MNFKKEQLKEARQAITKYAGAYCQKYRKDVLHMTVQEFSDLMNVNRVSITSFENGRTNNLLYVVLYEQATLGEYNKKFFRNDFFANAPDIKKLMKEVMNNE